MQKNEYANWNSLILLTSNATDLDMKSLEYFENPYFFPHCIRAQQKINFLCFNILNDAQSFYIKEFY